MNTANSLNNDSFVQDPVLVIDKYGADALRLYLINSPVVRAESLRFKEEGVFGVVKDVFLPWYNAYRFLVQNIIRWEKDSGCRFEPGQVCKKPGCLFSFALSILHISDSTCSSGRTVVCAEHSRQMDQCSCSMFNQFCSSGDGCLSLVHSCAILGQIY